MDSWLTILLTLILLVIPPIIKARKEKDKNKGPFRRAIEEIVLSSEEEDDSDSRYEYEEEPAEEREEPVFEPVIVKPAYSPLAQAAEEGGADRIPHVDSDSFKVDHGTSQKSEKKIDVQKMIIYSEIMKPKFKDFDLN